MEKGADGEEKGRMRENGAEKGVENGGRGGWKVTARPGCVFPIPLYLYGHSSISLT